MFLLLQEMFFRLFLKNFCLESLLGGYANKNTKCYICCYQLFYHKTSCSCIEMYGFNQLLIKMKHWAPHPQATIVFIVGYK